MSIIRQCLMKTRDPMGVVIHACALYVGGTHIESFLTTQLKAVEARKDFRVLMKWRCEEQEAKIEMLSMAIVKGLHQEGNRHTYGGTTAGIVTLS